MTGTRDMRTTLFASLAANSDPINVRPAVLMTMALQSFTAAIREMGGREVSDLDMGLIGCPGMVQDVACRRQAGRQAGSSLKSIGAWQPR